MRLRSWHLLLGLDFSWVQKRKVHIRRDWGPAAHTCLWVPPPLSGSHVVWPFFFSSVLNLSQIPWISICCIFMFFEVRVLSNIPYEILTHRLFRIVFINFWMFWKRYISRYSSVLIIYLVSFFRQCIYFYDFFHFSVFRFVLMSQNMVYLSECSVCKRIHVQLLGEVLYKC